MTLPRSCNWIRFVCATVMIAIVLPVSTRAQTHASQALDVQEMKNKLQHLEQEMNELRGQISAIEQGPQSPGGTAPAQTSGGAHGTERAAKAPREDEQKSSIDLYGFIMLDSGYDFKTNNPDWFDVIRPTQLPSFNGEFAPDGKAYFGVRQTRFGVKTSTPTGLVNLKTQF